MPKKPAPKGTRGGSGARRSKSGRIQDLPLKAQETDSARAVVGGATPKKPDPPHQNISFNFSRINYE